MNQTPAWYGMELNGMEGKDMETRKISNKVHWH